MQDILEWKKPWIEKLFMRVSWHSAVLKEKKKLMIAPNVWRGRVNDQTKKERRIRSWEVLREFKQCSFSNVEFEDLLQVQIQMSIR